MLKRQFLSAVAAVATVFAALVATSACVWFIYQPEEPSSLNDR